MEGKIRAGVIYNPILNELYESASGGGAFLNGTPIRVSDITDSERVLIVTGFSYEKGPRLDDLTGILKKFERRFCAFRRLGSAALDMAFVARGTFEGFYEENIKPWDMAAGKILVEEAGGKVTDFSGEEFNIYGNNFLATNGAIHGEMVETLSMLVKQSS